MCSYIKGVQSGRRVTAVCELLVRVTPQHFTGNPASALNIGRMNRCCGSIFLDTRNAVAGIRRHAALYRVHDRGGNVIILFGSQV